MKMNVLLAWLASSSAAAKCPGRTEVVDTFAINGSDWTGKRCVVGFFLLTGPTLSDHKSTSNTRTTHAFLNGNRLLSTLHPTPYVIAIHFPIEHAYIYTYSYPTLKQSLLRVYPPRLPQHARTCNNQAEQSLWFQAPGTPNGSARATPSSGQRTTTSTTST